MSVVHYHRCPFPLQEDGGDYSCPTQMPVFWYDESEQDDVVVIDMTDLMDRD